MSKSEISQRIKDEALRLGFSACGIAKVRYLQEEENHFSTWLQEGKHGEMSYLNRNKDKRLDPGKLLDNAKSMIVLLHPYYPQEQQKDPEAPVISKYAYGEDYHLVLKDKMRLLLDFINTEIGETKARIFTDSAPVAEKKWAELAGLGWRGKNSNLLTKSGSFFFISELIVDRELAYDKPYLKNHCGTCTRCIDACPTQAITKPYSVDARRCISYLTIELKGEIPEKFDRKFNHRVFGCDICQDVCPFNKKPIKTTEERFFPSPDLLKLTKEDWKAMDSNRFSSLFRKSAVKRTKYKGLRRNIDFLNRDN
ncbi:MAG: tRNA epoxyqueuosine(34) reductase QueG [Bacteroidota bacterium]|nr:tRNA epoxyqueuosine(34) reductase QueG [Bacteroidota bacterium]